MDDEAEIEAEVAGCLAALHEAEEGACCPEGVKTQIADMVRAARGRWLPGMVYTANVLTEAEQVKYDAAKLLVSDAEVAPGNFDPAEVAKAQRWVAVYEELGVPMSPATVAMLNEVHKIIDRLPPTETCPDHGPRDRP